MEENEQTEEEIKDLKAKQAGRDLASTGAKAFGTAIGGAAGAKVADFATKTGIGKELTNAVGDNIGKNPLLRNKLARMQPAIEKAKPALDAVAGGTGDKPDDSLTKQLPKTDSTDNESGSSSLFSGLNLKKIKLYATIAGIGIGLFSILFTITMIMVPLEHAVTVVGVTVEKSINFLTGKGFFTEEEAYSKKLKKEFDAFHRTPNRINDLDISLISATLHYGKVVNPDLWNEKADDVDYTDDGEGFKGFEITGKNAKSFYQWAGDWIGTANTIDLTKRRLTGALVSNKMQTTCGPKQSLWEEFLKAAGGPFNDLVSTIFNVASDNVSDAMKFVTFDWLVSEFVSFDQTGNSNFVDVVKDALKQTENIGYDLSNLVDFSEINLNLQCSGTTNVDGKDVELVPRTTFNKFNDYDKFKNYLRKFYIPNMILDCGNCQYKGYNWKSGQKDKKIESIIEEIFAASSQYNFLAGIKFDDVGSLTAYQPGAPSLPLEPYSNNTMGISSEYGIVRYINGKKDVHRGVDFARPQGTPILSIGDGVVISTTGHYSYGNVVTIGHDINGDGTYDFYSLYAHMFQKNVVDGQQIGGGQKIGEVGSTGNSTGNHLHLEIWDSSKKITDPIPTLKNINPNVTFK